MSRVPVLRGGSHWVGTGGGSVVSDSGELLLAYDAFVRGVRPLRRLLVMRELALRGGVLRPVGDPRQIRLLG